MSEAIAALRRKRDEYRTKWAALVEVLEDLGDPHPEGEVAEAEAGETDAEDGDDGDEDEQEEQEGPAARPKAARPKPAPRGPPAPGRTSPTSGGCWSPATWPTRGRRGSWRWPRRRASRTGRSVGW